LNRFVLSRFDLVIVLSPSDKHAILERRLALPQRVRMIEPAIEVEPSASGMRSSPPTVLWMARFVEQKDPLAFVRLAAALPGLQAKWVMAGDGPLLNDAKILSRQLSAPISFPGWVQRSHELMGRSDIYVSTSLWEGLPLTLLEAAAAGLAIVATDVAGNSDVARRGEIQLVEAADDHALRTAVHNLVMDNEHRHLRAERTKEALATYFDVTRMASETREVYEELSESAS
jgi:glycosyltransferase involved in cell wall biosynthesis